MRSHRAYQRLDERLDERKLAYMDEHKRTLPCQQGCFQCCRAQVLSVEAEGYAFADFLKTRLKNEQLDEIKARFEMWYEKLVAANFDVEVTAPRSYHAAFNWCPILDQATGKCSQYEMRPIICRTHYSLNVEDCEEWQTNEDGLAALFTEDLLTQPAIEVGYGNMNTVSFWQFWVGKHLDCSFANKAPPLFEDFDGRKT